MALDPKEVRYLIVHCSASPPSVYVDAKVIDRWHRERGFSKGGYHKVIRWDGVIEDGRPLSEIGAHAQGVNAKSIGICLAGGVEEKNVASDNFTAIQKQSLVGLLKVLKKRFPGAEVLGHRDIPGVTKSCPSWDVKAWWALQSQKFI